MKSKIVLDKLIQKQYKIAFAESMTGGRVVSQLIQHPGASEVVELGLVTYSNKMKEELLEVTPHIIKLHGVVSNAVSMIMAENVALKGYASIGVGITGSAGPTAEEGSQVGEVWVCIYKGGKHNSYHFQFGNLERSVIIEKTCEAVYSLLDKLI
ncbi:MAG: CinA family protein [Acholeplasmataceae bacterium]|jgi:PncC family amidohydrolase|nr:CinA family protein [Acholeplasmataceae bacterium]MDD4203724.1 CinA family protein [Acholeplasmataceae bacterium]MDD4468504.1 CinA family protein [Acholeplasmataceae bacterium]MDD4823714.1 CinA family protein [Acholeplasmataceae bacterium]MDY0316837.1 CinA family protein [Acholeplasmatales bacterium]